MTYRKVIDEARLTLTIERGFAAPISRLWDFFTRPDLLEQWWGPEDYPTTIKQHELRPGGSWLYCMTGPDGMRHWGLAEFKSINGPASFHYVDCFSDEVGQKNQDLPTSDVRVLMQAHDKGTLVTWTSTFGSVEHLRMLIEMGFEDGLASQCGRLDAILEGRRIIVTTIAAAPLEVVWRAYTNPDDIVQWNAASDDWHTTSARVDLRPGGTFSSRMEAKDGSFGFDFEGTYTRIIPQQVIEYAFGDRTARVDFLPVAAGVSVRVTFEPEAEHSLEEQREGWQAILDSFARHVGSAARHLNV